MMNHEGQPDTVLRFTVTCEIDSRQVSQEKIRQRLGDSLLWLDGVAKIDVDYSGELEAASEQA